MSLKETEKTSQEIVPENQEYTPLSEIPQCYKVCIWFPRRVFKDMVLFSAFVLRAIEFSQCISWKPGQSDGCPNFQTLIRLSWFPRNSL